MSKADSTLNVRLKSKIKYEEISDSHNARSIPLNTVSKGIPRLT